MGKKSFSFESIGTWWEIDIEDDLSELQFEKIKKLVHHYLTDFDNTYSRFIPSSLVSEMAKNSGTYSMPSDGVEMLVFYRDLYNVTIGAFTPLIGQTLADAGYDADYSFQEKKLVSPPSFSGSIGILDEKTIQMRRAAILDFGGVGKGFAIDKVGKILTENNIMSYTINAGGDILHSHAIGLPLRVGMENPSDTKQVLGVIELNNESVCSSAGNRRKWGKYHHIINPHTLTSPSDVLAVWVIAETATIADAMATCLFLVKPAGLEEKYKFNYFILYPDFSFDKSPGFKGNIFTSK